MEISGFHISTPPSMIESIPEANVQPQFSRIFLFEIAKQESAEPAITKDMLNKTDNVMYDSTGVKSTQIPNNENSIPMIIGTYQCFTELWMDFNKLLFMIFNFKIDNRNLGKGFF